MLGLEEGQAEEVVEHLLVLCQVAGGFDDEADLEGEGGLCGVDGDHP